MRIERLTSEDLELKIGRERTSAARLKASRKTPVKESTGSAIRRKTGLIASSAAVVISLVGLQTEAVFASPPPVMDEIPSQDVMFSANQSANRDSIENPDLPFSDDSSDQVAKSVSSKFVAKDQKVTLPQPVSVDEVLKHPEIKPFVSDDTNQSNTNPANSLSASSQDFRRAYSNFVNKVTLSLTLPPIPTKAPSPMPSQTPTPSPAPTAIPTERPIPAPDPTPTKTPEVKKAEHLIDQLYPLPDPKKVPAGEDPVKATQRDFGVTFKGDYPDSYVRGGYEVLSIISQISDVFARSNRGKVIYYIPPDGPTSGWDGGDRIGLKKSSTVLNFQFLVVHELGHPFTANNPELAQIFFNDVPSREPLLSHYAQDPTCTGQANTEAHRKSEEASDNLGAWIVRDADMIACGYTQNPYTKIDNNSKIKYRLHMDDIAKMIQYKKPK